MTQLEEGLANFKGSAMGSSLIEIIGLEKATDFYSKVHEATEAWDMEADLHAIRPDMNYLMEFLIVELTNAQTTTILQGLFLGKTRTEVNADIVEQVKNTINLALFVGAHLAHHGYEFTVHSSSLD